MDREEIRTWGPVAVVLVLLPLAFVAVRAVFPPIGGPPPAAPVAPAPEPRGTTRCAGCHPTEAAAWSASTHARAERELGPADPHTLEAVGPDGKTASFPLIRAVGADPLVQYLVDTGGGRLQVTQAATRSADGGWFDVFGDGRGPGEWGHWTGDAMTWNSRCGECHTTGFRKHLEKPTADGPFRYASTHDELGVGCLACHREHVGEPGELPDPAPTAVFDTCASCHARRSALDEEFRPGDPFLDHFAPALVDRSGAFLPNGGVRDEDFEWTAFVGAVMHGKGVTCTSCHDPHTGRTRAEGDALCLSCHAALPGFAPHDRHAATVGCVACHMPTTVYMQADTRHDHAFTRPDPALERDFGVPSACSRCHADRGVDFAVRAAKDWWGLTAANARSVAFAKARAADPAAVPGLLEALAAGAPAWKAAAALHLDPFLDRPEVVEGLRRALADPEPLVRFATADAVAPIAPGLQRELDPLLQDPVKAVRVSASRALRGRMGPNDTAARDYVRYLELHADDAAALFERATWALERGQPAAALADLQRAARSDPRSPAILDALAIALASAGRNDEVAEVLRRAVALAPDDAETWQRLGLAEAGAGREEAARAALRTSVEKDPSLVRSWYNLGLLEARVGGGVRELEQAVSLAPDDPDLRYALASVLAANEPARALAEARRVLDQRPDHPGAVALVRQLVR